MDSTLRFAVAVLIFTAAMCLWDVTHEPRFRWTSFAARHSAAPAKCRAPACSCEDCECCGCAAKPAK